MTKAIRSEGTINYVIAVYVRWSSLMYRCRRITKLDRRTGLPAPADQWRCGQCWKGRLEPEPNYVCKVCGAEVIEVVSLVDDASTPIRILKAKTRKKRKGKNEPAKYNALGRRILND